jgi:hypothetical protein
VTTGCLDHAVEQCSIWFLEWIKGGLLETKLIFRSAGTSLGTIRRHDPPLYGFLLFHFVRQTLALQGLLVNPQTTTRISTKMLLDPLYDQAAKLVGAPADQLKVNYGLRLH